MSEYHRLSAIEKRARALATVREPAIACPACDTMTTPSDLLEHVRTRCAGPRDPGPGSVWITWRDAIRQGVPKATLSDMVRRGEVRARGELQDRRYLLRDLALRMAQRKAARRR